MSKSRRKTPIEAHTTAKSEKKDKRRYHKKARGIQNTLIRKGRLDDVPQVERIREYEGGDWTFAKDGKSYVGKMKGKIIIEYDESSNSDRLHYRLEKEIKKRGIMHVPIEYSEWVSYMGLCRDFFKKGRKGRLIPPGGWTFVIKRNGQYKAFSYSYEKESRWHSKREDVIREIKDDQDSL